MPIVEIPDIGLVEFPDEMPQEDIERAIRKELLIRKQIDVKAERQEINNIFLDEFGHQLISNLDQAGIGVAQGLASLAETGTRAVQQFGRNILPTHLLPFDVPGLSSGMEQFTETAGQVEDVFAQRRQEVQQLGEETAGSSLTRNITAGVVSTLPSIVAAPGGVTATSTVSGLQSFTQNWIQFQRHFESQGDDEITARAKAYAPALAGGVITGLITRGFGETGIEAIKNAVRNPEAFRQVVGSVSRQAGLEGVEEFIDELGQSAVEKLAVNPELTATEVLSRSFTALAAGLVAGGLITGTGKVIARKLPPKKSPELKEREQETSDILNKLQQFPDQAQQFDIEVGQEVESELEVDEEVESAGIVAFRNSETGETFLFPGAQNHEIAQANPGSVEFVQALENNQLERGFVPAGETQFQPMEGDVVEIDPVLTQNIDTPAGFTELQMSDPTNEEAKQIGQSESERLSDRAPSDLDPVGNVNIGGGENIPSDPGELNISTVQKPRDFTIADWFHSGQFNYWFGKFGPTAKQAWEKMALSEFRMRENISRDIEFTVDDVMKRLPRSFRKEGGKTFFEVLDGKTMDDVRAEWGAQPNGEVVINMAERVKGRLEEIRQTILSVKRDKLNSYLNGLTRNQVGLYYAANVNPDRDTTNLSKKEMVEDTVVSLYPNDWGISDGSYLPHLFFGQWVATAHMTGEEAPRNVLRAETPEEAKARLRELVKSTPELADAEFVIRPDMSIPADVVRLGDKQFFTLLQNIGKQFEVSGTEARDATTGILGRRASKQKFFGNLLKRYGAKNFETNFSKVMQSYLYGFHRWRILSELQNDVSPMIDGVRRTGRPNAARELETMMEYLWGKPTQVTLDFDAFVQRLPVVGNRIRPLALDRWTRTLRATGAKLFLSTPRFATINSLQPLQGLYPIVGERLLTKAKILQHTGEGRKILDQYGVTFDVGAFGEPTLMGKTEKLRQRFTREKSNQEMGFLAMYLHGLETGLHPEDAAEYAKLRGQLFTQFTPLIVDSPKIMRGPTGATVFQFMRFPIKQLELTYQLIRDKNVPGLVRMMGTWALFGGLAFFWRQLFQDSEDALDMKRKLDKTVGRDVADAVFYGLPGLLNLDLGGSLVLLDKPFGNNIYEILGRRVLGPSVNFIVDMARQISTEPREPMTPLDRTLSAMNRVPALRPLVSLYDLSTSNLDATSADGEVRFKRKMTDIIAGLGSFRSANESNVRLAVDGTWEVKEKVDRMKNQLFVEIAAGGSGEDVLDEIRQFNQRWPEVAITGEEIRSYLKSRIRNMSKTDLQRLAGKKYLPLLPPEAIIRESVPLE